MIFSPYRFFKLFVAERRFELRPAFIVLENQTQPHSMRCHGFVPIASAQIFNIHFPRLCRPMCGRGFAHPDAAGFSHGATPLRSGAAENRQTALSIAFYLIQKRRGIAQK
jgi:hypothetical protein